jgi:hypothetical protein
MCDPWDQSFKSFYVFMTLILFTEENALCAKVDAVYNNYYFLDLSLFYFMTFICTKILDWEGLYCFVRKYL